MTPAEQVARIAKAPLIHQPGTMWEYSMAVDILGRVVEAASGKRLAVVLDERLFKPLKMADSSFWLPSEKMSRLAQPLPVDPASGQKISVLDVSSEPMNDSAGAGALSTANDYLRFAQMLLNGGELDAARVVSRSTVKLMTSDHLGTRIAAPFQPGELLLGTPGYTFGLGFAVRQGDGVAGVAGSAGEFMWAGYAGTYFWVDPKEEIVGIYMSQAPSPIRAYYRKMFKGSSIRRSWTESPPSLTECEAAISRCLAVQLERTLVAPQLQTAKALGRSPPSQAVRRGFRKLNAATTIAAAGHRAARAHSSPPRTGECHDFGSPPIPVACRRRRRRSDAGTISVIAGLSDAARAHDRSARGRRPDRRVRPPDRAKTIRQHRQAGLRGEHPGRRRQYRHGPRRTGGARRLYDSRRCQQLRRQSKPLQHDPL